MNVRKVGTVRLGSFDYDLAINGRGVLAKEGLDLYGRPTAEEVPLRHLVEGKGPQSSMPWDQLAQELLTLLAQTMIERDAALASLQKGS